MAKRKLSRQQLYRSKRIQAIRLQRAQKTTSTTVSDNSTFDSTASDHSGLSPPEPAKVIANFGSSLMVSIDNLKHLACYARQNLGPIVCGDQVIIQRINDQEGIIIALTERRSLLAKPMPSGDPKPIAANIDQIIIVSSPLPTLNTLIIDRYLAAVELAELTPVIVINKVDLVSPTKINTLYQQLQCYAALGYSLVYHSTINHNGADQLLSLIRDKTSILVGQSGVGKSSITNELIPDKNIRVNAVDAATGQGKHTTTTSWFYPLSQGGAIIDSPGVRDFGLWQISKSQIAWGFRELRPYLGQCKYRNCSHITEPDCALQNALTQGDIHAGRLHNYLEIIQQYHHHPI